MFMVVYAPPADVIMTVEGVKAHCAPGGRFVDDMMTGPENPLTAPRERTKLAVPPAWIVCDKGAPGAEPMPLTVKLAFTVAVAGVDAVAMKFASPLYAAVITCTPAGKAAATNVAVPLFNAPIPRVEPLSSNAIVPVGVPEVAEIAVAVSVTGLPNDRTETEVTRGRLIGVWETWTVTFSLPASTVVITAVVTEIESVPVGSAPAARMTAHTPKEFVVHG